MTGLAIIIAVIGSKESGKTTTIEALVKGLTKQNYRIGTVKHVPEPNFTIDTKGTDTWRHVQAGARKTAIVAPKELAIIKKVDTADFELREILESYGNHVDIIILEGFRNLVRNEASVAKIAAVKTSKEAIETLKNFKSVIAFAATSMLANRVARELKIPAVDVLKEPEKLVEIVLDHISLHNKRQ